MSGAPAMLNCRSFVPQVLHLKSLPLQVDVLAFDFLDRPSVSRPPVCCRVVHAAAVICIWWRERTLSTLLMT